MGVSAGASQEDATLNGTWVCHAQWQGPRLMLWLLLDVAVTVRGCPSSFVSISHPLPPTLVPYYTSPYFDCTLCLPLLSQCGKPD